MSAVDNCFLPKTDNLMQPIHMQFSQKFKAFSQFFRAFSKSALNFEHFQKKDDLIAYLFLTLRRRKTWLDICVKSPASDYPLKRNMVNGSQLCLNLSERSCSIFVAQWEANLVAKSLF